MRYQIQELEEMLQYLAAAIANRPDGATYIPIFERVEQELLQRKGQASTLDRIQALAKRSVVANNVTNLAA